MGSCPIMDRNRRVPTWRTDGPEEVPTLPIALESCDELRGGMDASQYKDYVLTLLS